MVLAFDAGIGEDRHRACAQDLCEPVEAATDRRPRQTRDEPRGQQDERGGERDVEEEHPAPAETVDEEPAERWSYGEGETGGRRTQQIGRAPLPFILEHGSDDG